MMVARALATKAGSSQSSSLWVSMAAARSSRIGWAMFCLLVETHISTNCILRRNRSRPERCRAISFCRISKAFRSCPSRRACSAVTYRSVGWPGHREADPSPVTGSAGSGLSRCGRGGASWVRDFQPGPRLRIGRRCIIHQGGVEQLRNVGHQRLQLRTNGPRDGLVVAAQGSQASTTKRCRSSQARLQGSAIAFSAASSNSSHFLSSARRFKCLRSSVGGASSWVGSERSMAARNSPQRNPRSIR